MLAGDKAGARSSEEGEQVEEKVFELFKQLVLVNRLIEFQVFLPSKSMQRIQIHPGIPTQHSRGSVLTNVLHIRSCKYSILKMVQKYFVLVLLALFCIYYFGIVRVCRLYYDAVHGAKRLRNICHVLGYCESLVRGALL